MKSVILAVFLCAVFSIQPCRAQEADIEGAKDHPAVGRYKGSVISAYEMKEYEEVRFLKPDKIDLAGTGSAQLTDKFSIPLAGRSTIIVYEGPQSRSILEVLNNYIAALTAKGFSLIGRCRGQECGLIGSNVWIQDLYTRGARTSRIHRPVNSNSNDDTIYALLKKQTAAGNIWVSLYGSQYTREENILPNFLVSVLEEKPMQGNSIVFADAKTMQDEIEQNGRIALYGLYFDTGKATLKPESDKQLAEIAKFLKAKPNLKLLVVGHTDNQGTLEYNKTLSEERATTVARALKSGYAVPDGQLTPLGVGMAAPVETNKTDAGRAKNRRVELVSR